MSFLRTCRTSPRPCLKSSPGGGRASRAPRSGGWEARGRPAWTSAIAAPVARFGGYEAALIHRKRIFLNTACVIHRYPKVSARFLASGSAARLELCVPTGGGRRGASHRSPSEADEILHFQRIGPTFAPPREQPRGRNVMTGSLSVDPDRL